MSIVLLIENKFNSFFGSFTKGRVTVSWQSPGQGVVSIPKTEKVSNGTRPSQSVQILGLGTTTPGITIPSTLPNATFLFKFRLPPEERLIENRQSICLYYGQGYQWGGGWGLMSYPLFRLILDANTNHLKIRFDGGKQMEWGTGGFRDTYPFKYYEVDLGHVDAFKNWTDFLIWIDLDVGAFERIVIGKNLISPPSGYDVIEPADFYKPALLKGVFVGDFNYEATTNLTLELDDVQVWSGYYSPPVEPSPPLFLPIPLLLSVGIGTALILFAYLDP